ncbi:MAG: plastocyanin/azurin family copper-binding protein [Candidatus Dormiibacterota bacterium]
MIRKPGSGAAVLAALIMAALWLAGCGSTVGGTSNTVLRQGISRCVASRAKSHVTVDANSAFRFVPATACLRLNGTVTWINTTTDLDHTTTDEPSLAASPSDASIPAGGHGWDLALPAGHSAHLTFRVAGVYHYFCIVHETLGMLGVVVVVGRR